jgi:hypothetical protein
MDIKRLFDLGNFYRFQVIQTENQCWLSAAEREQRKTKLVNRINATDKIIIRKMYRAFVDGESVVNICRNVDFDQTFISAFFVLVSKKIDRSEARFFKKFSLIADC